MTTPPLQSSCKKVSNNGCQRSGRLWEGQCWLMQYPGYIRNVTLIGVVPLAVPLAVPWLWLSTLLPCSAPCCSSINFKNF